MRRSASVFLVLAVVIVSAARAQSALPRIAANDNRVSAGRLENGLLTLKLDVVRATWHPDRDEDPGVDILAFQEEGHAPSIPAPLIRVPVGTEIRTTVRNTLTDSAIVVFGLSGGRTLADSVRIQPGEARELVTRASAAGTFLYFACTRVRGIREGSDRMLSGAFVVDEPGKRMPDRVLVLHQWIDPERLKPFPGAVEEVLTINGKSWPNTEHFNYNLGDTIRWRIVNGSFDVHPMHLHGAYYTVLSRGKLTTDSTYTAQQKRHVVTERLGPLSTVMMEWSPERAGNWLFHCHLTFHIQPHPPLGDMKASSEKPAAHTMPGMGGLVALTTIHGPVAKDVTPRRKLRLVVQQYDSISGEFVPPFSYRFDDEKKFASPGPPIVVQQNEPIAITVVNRAKDPTSVHWHGLEIQSYYDGVPHHGGDAKRTTPLVQPNDSFIVKMTPPRAGTFIYHSHADEIRQQGGGLYGAFVVLPAGKQWDAEHDRPIVFSDVRDTTNAVLINGSVDGTITVKAGETYRLRFINITLARPNLQVWLMNWDTALAWNAVAKDGMDLPAVQAGTKPAKSFLTIGETLDVLFTPQQRGELTLSARAGGGNLLGKQRLNVE
jgi:manganese oxidase